VSSPDDVARCKPPSEACAYGGRTLPGQLPHSSTNQTGIEIVRPDFLPITLTLIWR
jgi:hypothetical protein